LLPAPVAAAPELSARDIDQALHAAWAQQAIEPSSRVDDATFLRRAWLDLAGVVPPPDTVVRFAGDRSPDKRRAAVAEILAGPRWAEHWANVWERLLLGPLVKIPVVDRDAFHEWMRSALASNLPYDQLVYQLVTATGRNQSDDDDEPVNGAVNWLLRFRGVPEDLAGTTSRVFLGVQIQCAQCHDHKTEKWKQQDFQKFAACFMRAQTVPLDGPMMKGLKRALVRDIDRPLPRFMKDNDLALIGRATPTALDGTPMVDGSAAGGTSQTAKGTVRASVAAWITTNPSFAREAVNRVWAHFLGRGFVDPIDDIRPSNPSEAPEIEAALAKDFTEKHYDLKHLMRTVALSRAYGLSTVPATGQDPKTSPVLWSRFRAKPLGPNELLDAVFDATAVDDALRRLGRFNVEELTERLRTLYGFVFDVDEEFDRPTFEGTITQALIGLNGRLVAGGSTALPGTAVARVARSEMTDAQKVEALYLRTLGRKPSADELGTWTKYLANPPALAETEPPKPPPAQKKPAGPFRPKNPNDPLARVGERIPETRDPKIAAVEDLMWTLLNSSEFVLNH